MDHDAAYHGAGARGDEQFDIERSKPMQYISVTIPNELVTPTLRAIGEFERLHVVDLNAHGQVSKQQFAYKKRLGEIADSEKKFKAVEEQLTKREVPIGHIDWDLPLSVHSEAAVARYPDIVAGATEFATETEASLNANMAFERTIEIEIARREELRHVLLAAPRLVPPAAQLGADAEAGLSARMERYVARGANPVSINHEGVALDDLSMAGGRGDGVGEGFTSYICGVIPVKSQGLFSRLVYRISRGSNAMVKFEQIEDAIQDPVSGEIVPKSVFCVVTIGRQLHRRISKYCPLVGATVYQLPPDQSESTIMGEVQRLDSEIREQRQALERTTQSIMRVLADVATPQDRGAATEGPCLLRMWQQLLIRERATIDTLMKCEFHTTLVFLTGWCPTDAVDELAYALQHATEGLGGKPALDRNAPPPAGVMPPTFIPTNKFTASFQSIVNTYGMPRYREFNPGLFTVVTFPFLFGVMFGDVGHGFILAMAGLLFLVFEGKLLKLKKQGQMPEMLDMVFSGRYIIFMMGLFATYIGVIYNDFMSIPINAQGSHFHEVADTDVYKTWTGTVQSFGVDAGWYHNKNSLKFFNSLKMKMAVIIGVIHMTFGMILSLKNHIFFKDSVSIVFEFIPRMVFMLCTFGWMITMIIIKWCIDWRVGWDPADVPGKVRNPPNLIQTTIDMFLSAGSVPEDEQLFAGQAGLQVAFVLLALFSIPLMLLPKPLIENQKRKGNLTWFLSSPADEEFRQHGHHAAEAHHDEAHHDDGDLDALGHAHSSSLSASQRAASSSMDEERDGFGAGSAAAASALAANGASAASGDAHAEGGHAHTLGDSMIHQAIHTIEFVLGAVSNTASYLRLWALSLAHAQLAEVFWEKLLMEYGIEQGGFITFIGSYAWMGATFGVIICMDSLECFLHALRLHWVEFQNKFYYADGYAFKPFAFKPEAD